MERSQTSECSGPAFGPSVLWLGLVEVCIFCLCVLFLLQVAAVYRDPSVGNLINVMIVKLIVVHNEQVSAGVATWATALQVLLLERTVPALSVLVLKDSLENKGCYRKTPGIRDEEAFCALSGAIDY